MRYGIVITNLGSYADARTVARLAQAAEAAGWEGLFVWDHLGFVWGAPSGDPWVILTAAATSTKHLKLGTYVTPLPRRRPQVLAQTLATLDILSEGRAVFGVGLGGVPEEFTVFGEPGDAGRRAAILDEGLEVLNRLWSGEQVMHHGTHYTINGVTLAPLPAQRPRIPIWVGGTSPPALRRAARWDGWAASFTTAEGEMTVTPRQLADKVATVRQHRAELGTNTNAPFDFEMALDGYSMPTDGALAREYETAGVTWWLEAVHDMRGPPDEMVARVEAGPPR